MRREAKRVEHSEALSSSIRIIRSGLFTTIQDFGRRSSGYLGIPFGGAMDRIAFELGNRLVGNDDDAASIEMTLTGDEIELSDACVIAITGADMNPVLEADGIEDTPLPQNTPIVVQAGCRLRFGTVRRGCRCYLAVSGGIQSQKILGSRCPLFRCGVRGPAGRKIAAGDVLAVGAFDRTSVNRALHSGRPIWTAGWSVRQCISSDNECCELRVVPGEHFLCLSTGAKESLLSSEFLLTSKSDRMGFRLRGETPLLTQWTDLFSQGVTPGTVQLPPDGNPILLMMDCAPTGGYPDVLHVITADLPSAAQIRPGQRIRFRLVDLADAHRILRAQRLDLERSIQMAALMDEQNEVRIGVRSAGWKVSVP